MSTLANQYNSHDLYNDTRGDSDRYVYQQIKQRQFSPEAQTVLTLANRIVEESMPQRLIMMRTNPELYLQAWDAGWYQIKQIIKEYPVDSKDEFDQAFKELQNKIAEGVYYFEMLSR